MSLVDLNVVRTRLAADLTATGLHVATNPRKAHAPCVLVGPIVEVSAVGGCAWECTVPVYVVAPAPGDEKAVAWLASVLTDVLDAMAADTEPATLGTYDVGQGDLPAYEITATLTANGA